MNEIIVSNICSQCAMVTDPVSGTRKKRGEIMGAQMLIQVFYGAGSMILKGFSCNAWNIAADFEYSVAVFRFKDSRKRLKIAFILDMLMYSVFSLIISNYVAAANIVAAVTTAVSLIKAGPTQDVFSSGPSEEK